MCDDIKDITFLEALMTLINMISELSSAVSDKISLKIETMMNLWYEMMPNWLSDLLIMSSTAY